VIALPLPEPPLAGKRCRLRSWELGDAPALAAAWSDAEVRRWLPVPDVVDQVAAAAWIAGQADRRQAGLALDLVASDRYPFRSVSRTVAPLADAADLLAVMAGEGSEPPPVHAVLVP